jgi:hypothetical protein
VGLAPSADRFKGGAGADSAPDFGQGDTQEQVEQLA